MLRLSEYLKSDPQPVLHDWDAFAESTLTGRAQMSQTALRDSLSGLLGAIAEDMEYAQSAEERSRKSKGLRPQNSPGLSKYGRLHAADRFASGFNLNQVVSEYRALRASILHHWTAGIVAPPPGAFDEMVRFNEAMDQALTESLADYSERLEHARDLFIGVLSHGLRSPLSAAHMSATILMRAELLAAHHLKAVVRIFNGTTRMRSMIDDLLDFTRVRMGAGLSVDARPTDLYAVSDQVVEETRASHPTRTVTLAGSGDLDGVWDDARLSQLLSNLLGNAIQHGGASGPVVLTLDGASEATVVITVHNGGAPISPEAQPVIFDFLVRGAIKESDGKKRSGGLGLGLYIARHIARGHGGDIEVMSSAEHGTTFTVRLPRQSRRDERIVGTGDEDLGAAARRPSMASRSPGLDRT